MVAVLSKRTSGVLQQAIALHQDGELHQAGVLYRKVLCQSPNHSDALHLMGLIQSALGDNQQAIELISRAISANPDEPVFHNNLGLVYDQLGASGNAIDCYRKAIALKPDYLDAVFKLGCAQHEQGQYTAAIESFQRALEICPTDAKTWSNLGGALNATGETDDALFCYQQAVSLDADSLELRSNALFAANYSESLTPADLFLLHREVGRRIQETVPVNASFAARSNVPDGRIRLGFVSGDLRTHPVGYFLESALGCLDRDVFEVRFYATSEHEDDLSRRLRGHGDHWQRIARLDDGRAAQIINDDRIDILVDLSGHTANNRLGVFARKPAPLQVAWLGYFATTGLATMDYILVDPYLCTEADQQYFTERLFFLPDTRLCFTAPSSAVEVGELPALKTSVLTLACFNNLAKINSAVIELWAEVMSALPEARLILKAKALGDSSVRSRLLSRLGELGVSADRLLLEGWSSRGDYFEAYRQVDIALDPFPFTGGTTSVESLWMGVPFVTLNGDRLLSRQGVSMLKNLGMDDWIASSREDYVRLVTKHCRDIEGLAVLRQTLRHRLLSSPLCDARRFAKNLTSALQTIFRSGKCEAGAGLRPKLIG